MTTDDLVPRILAAIEEVERLCDVVDDASMHGVESTAATEFMRLADPDGHRRRCVADRRIVERHKPRTAIEGPYEGEPICGCSNGQNEWHATPFPCDDILDLADAYDIHPNPEPGSLMAADLEEAGDTVPVKVIVRDLAERVVAFATVHREEDWFIARVTAPDVASQGRTEAEARANLREAVELYLASRET